MAADRLAPVSPHVDGSGRDASTTSRWTAGGRCGRAGDRLRARALGLLAELAREHPPLRARPPGAGARPAGLRLLARARLGDLDRGLRPAVLDFCERWRSATAPWSATRWAASSPPRRRSPSRGGSGSWCSSRRPASRARGCGASRPRSRRGCSPPGTPLVFRLQTRAFRRPKRAGDGVRRHLLQPGRAAARAALGVLRGRDAQPKRSSRRSSSLAGYDILDRLGEVEVPTLIVWGAQGPRRPPADAVGYARRMRGLAPRDLRRTGHVPMAERPVRFNRVLETFLGSSGERGAGARSR